MSYGVWRMDRMAYAATLPTPTRHLRTCMTSNAMFSPSLSQSSHSTSHWQERASCSSCCFRGFLSCGATPRQWCARQVVTLATLHPAKVCVPGRERANRGAAAG
jgi:hypothetical protein